MKHTKKNAVEKFNLIRDIKKNKLLYLFMIPVIVYFIIFHYVPMAGIVVAFEKYFPRKGIFGSQWVWFKNFENFFKGAYAGRVIKNTIIISVLEIVFSFPAPIIFALLLNEVKNAKFKKVVQTVSYMPHFISSVVFCGLVADFCSSRGFITDFIVMLGGTRQSLIGNADYFRTIYTISGIWQTVGYGSIIYMAALSGVDKELYEAAMLDGANRLQQTWHVTLPGIANTIVMLFILRMGSFLTVGSEKLLLLYAPSTYEVADVISTYVYRKGILDADFGYSTAVNLFNSVINTALLILTNKISRKVSDMSLF